MKKASKSESAPQYPNLTALGIVALVALVCVVALVKPSRVEVQADEKGGLKVGVEKRSSSDATRTP